MLWIDIVPRAVLIGCYKGICTEGSDVPWLWRWTNMSKNTPSIFFHFSLICDRMDRLNHSRSMQSNWCSFASEAQVLKETSEAWRAVEWRKALFFWTLHTYPQFQCLWQWPFWSPGRTEERWAKLLLRSSGNGYVHPTQGQAHWYDESNVRQ